MKGHVCLGLDDYDGRFVGFIFGKTREDVFRKANEVADKYRIHGIPFGYIQSRKRERKIWKEVI